MIATETIEITDLRVPRLPVDDPATVIVVERVELERSAPMLTDDIIRSIPSVAMFRRSSSLAADPTSQGLNLRGVGPSAVARALAVRDGIPINDPFGGWVYWRAVPSTTIERIEIQPSGATLFGNFGLGGVMGIASRPIRDRSIEAILATGSYGTRRGAVRGTDRIGGFGFEIDAERVQTDGFAPIAPHDRGAVDGPASSDHVSTGVRVERIDGDSTLRGFARFFDEDLAAGTQHTTAGVRTWTYGASWRYVYERSRLDVTAFGGHQLFEQTRARVAPDRSSAEPSSSQRTPSNNQGASAMWTARAGTRHTLQVGVDAVRVAGTATDTITPARVTDSSVLERSAGGEQRFLGAFVQDSIRVTPKLELGAALRVDGWQQIDGQRRLVRGSGEVATTGYEDRSEVQVSPRLGVLHHLDGNLAVRGSVYRAFRAPTLNELYRSFQVGTVMTAANAALRPEVLWGGELGPQLVIGTFVGRVTGFWNEISDPIFNATLAMPTPDGAARMRQNLGQARVAGFELETSWRPHEAWLARLAYTYADARVTEAPGAPDLVRKYLAQDPRHRAVAHLAFDDPDIATVSAELRYASRQFEDDLNLRPMDAYVVVDVFARRRLAYGVSAFASVVNLFDREYLVGRAGVDTLGQPRTWLFGVAFASGTR